MKLFMLQLYLFLPLSLLTILFCLLSTLQLGGATSELKTPSQLFLVMVKSVKQLLGGTSSSLATSSQKHRTTDLVTNDLARLDASNDRKVHPGHNFKFPL
jgi:hypothetical protein